MRENRTRHPLRIPAALKLLTSAERVVRGRLIPFVIEIVQQCDEAPGVFVFTELSRVTAHRRFDREGVLPKALALSPFGEQCPRSVACQQSIHGYLTGLG